MSKWTGYFKVVQPTTDTVQVTDNQSMDGSSYGNYSWYQRLVQGSASRVSRYNEYDVMDNDVEVARALDIIAEEMSSNNTKTDLPLNIDIQAEESNHMSPTTLMTLRAAMRYWCNLHDWDNRLFKVSRNTAKYGDCFFRRGKTQRTRWTYIHPKLVTGAMVDEHDVTKILGYQVRTEQKTPFNVSAPSLGGSNQQYDEEFVPASEIIRFSLNDDMSAVAPFGESILLPVYRAHKQKELLEDAIIIYRTVRAPERRVFYIDVGKMPPAMTKKYLEQIKNEIRQKKIPSQAGGQTNVDSVYNPASMSEDFYFAQRADGKGSRVETLPGGQGLGELADLEYFQNKVFRGLRVPISWMNELNGGAVWNDGKVGQAYMQELIFGKYIERLQGYVDKVLDIEFKRYLRENNIIIDESLYKIRLPDATDFEKFRNAESDAALMNSYSTADGIKYMSKRQILKRFAQWTDDEILANEALKCEEMGISPDDPKRLQLIYGDGSPADLSPGGPGGAPGGGGGGIPDLGGAPGSNANGDTSTTDLADTTPSAEKTGKAAAAPAKA